MAPCVENGFYYDNCPGFDYRYVIIGLLALVFIVACIYAAWRLRHNAAQHHQGAIQALARDVENIRASSAPLYGRGVWRHYDGGDDEVLPPYKPRDKNDGQAIHLSNLEGTPPRYADLHSSRPEPPPAVAVGIGRRQDRGNSEEFEDVYSSMARPRLAT